MKRLAGILVLVCSAIVACKWNDPLGLKKRRVAEPRLHEARFERCCQPSEIRSTCTGTGNDAREARALLLVAHGECLDHAFAAVEKQAKEDLPAAYLIRAQRNGDPVDYLRALSATGSSSTAVAFFNRALAQEKLGLTTEAIRSWDEVVKRERSGWADEARTRRDRLMAVADPAARFADFDDAIFRRDRTTIRKLALEFPSDAMRFFETWPERDLGIRGVVADALAEAGDPYARAIVEAMKHPADEAALDQGLAAMARGNFESAASLLERAGNPLHLAARCRVAADDDDPNPLLDAIAPIAVKNRYRDLAGRTHVLRAASLDFSGHYLDALEVYEQALDLTAGEPTTKVEVLTRRSANYKIIGSPEKAFRDSLEALSLLPSVAILDGRHQTYGTAGDAARDLGFPLIAIQYRNAAVALIRKAVASGHRKGNTHLTIALRHRANAYLELGNDQAAERDLLEATVLAEAALPEVRPLLRMRLAEVRGHQALRKGDSTGAAARFTEAIELAPAEHSTYRAVLHYGRALARRGDPRADQDLATALKILREEASLLRTRAARGAYENLWKPYFARFQTMHQELIRSRIAQGDHAGAFVHAEQARAFEPMELLLQSEPPPGFRRIESANDLGTILRDLPEDTIILQYLVLADRTYAFVITRDGVELSPHRPGRAAIEDWVRRVSSAVRSGQPFSVPMRAAYEELFAVPLASTTPRSRIVIVPDGPMHGLPFAALQDANGQYLIEKGSVAVAGSTSLYLYALHRDRQFARAARPGVLIVGDPAVDPRRRLDPIPNAHEEALQLHGEYQGSQLLPGRDATTRNFFGAVKNATIVHFAGHAIANPRNPWRSMLVLAPEGTDTGELTAEKLLTNIPDLQHTRLIVLAACSTASGESVGPEGLAPLVRPLIAARVPAVVGTSWDVKDTATIKDLLVSFHRHYRNGDDVAVALRKAQLAMLREPAKTWAALQVVGYAGSPYAHHVALEETHSEHVHPQNSLHRPDGLHSQ